MEKETDPPINLAGIASPTQDDCPFRLSAGDFPPTGVYLLTWLRDESPGEPCQAAYRQAPQTLPTSFIAYPWGAQEVSSGCSSLANLEPQSAPTCNPVDPSDCESGVCSDATRSLTNPGIPARLSVFLLSLQQESLLEIQEVLPNRSGLRLVASAEAAARISQHPETNCLLLLEAQAEFREEEAAQANAPAVSIEAAPAEPVTPTQDSLALKPGFVEPAPRLVLSPGVPQAEVVIYNWVNNQGENSPIVYNWVEISSTGTIVAQGDDTYTLVDLGFPFNFYGTSYTQAYVSSNGFVSFGSGSSSFSNSSIPNSGSPNNAVYGFWDDLRPTGGDNGNVYTQQVGPTTYVIEWYQVDKYGSLATFEIILNGAEDTILFQYQAISSSSSATVGVENSNGTIATQYAYNTSGAIFNNLAILFSPATTTVYTIAGIVLDYDDTPLQYVSVRTSDGPAYASDITDAAGAYQLTVISGTYSIQARKYYDILDPLPQAVTVPPDQSQVNFTFPERFTIGGTVRDYDTTPLQSVYVTASGSQGSASDSTDAAGVYQITVISGTYQVQAREYYNKFDPDPQTVSVPPNQNQVDFTFPERFTIGGSVSDFLGNPLAGVRVETDWSDPVYVNDTSDSRGIYEITVISGAYQLEASLEGYLSPPILQATTPPSQTGVDFTFPEQYTVTGIVQDYDHTPLQGIYVSSSGGVSAFTDSQGRYTFHLPPGLYCLSVYHSTYPEPSPQPLLVPDQTGLDFTFPQRYTISGIVRDFGGSPLDSVHVEVYQGPVDTYDYTGLDGSYTLNVISGTYTLEASQTGRVGSETLQVSVPPDQTQADFTFPESYLISGAVRSGGTPLAGVSVYVCPAQGGSCGYDYTGSDGGYAVRTPAGTWDIEVNKYPLPSPPEQQVTTPPSQSGIDFDFDAIQSYTIAGTVTVTGGLPLEGVQVVAATGDCWEDITVKTNASGQYTLTVYTADTYLVEAWGQRRLVDAPPSASGVDFTFPALYSIAGTVRDPSGQPLAGVEVHAWQGRFGSDTETDALGQYQTRLPAGVYQVWVDPEADEVAPPPPQTVTLPPNQDTVDFTFPTSYHLQGIVRDLQGNSIQSAKVEASGPAGSAVDYTLNCGVYDLLLPSGVYTVTVSRYGYLTSAPQSVSLPPTRRDVDFTLSPEHTIAGMVKDSNNNPLEGATIRASGLNDFDSDVTDANGAYQLQVVPGDYQVSASKTNLPPPPAQSISAPPDHTNVDFTFPQAYLVQGSVKDNGGQGLPGARVASENATCGGWSPWASTDSSGAYTLTLVAGSYTLDAVYKEYTTPQRLQVSVPPGSSSQDLTIPLPTRYLIHGVARDDQGTPLEGIRVSAATCGQPGDNTTTAASGAYTLTLQAGAFRLNASGQGYDSQVLSLNVTGSQTGVDFTLTPLSGGGPFVVYGYVTDEGGNPLSSAEVSVVSGPSDDWFWTSNCGRYRLDLENPGSYTILASAEGYTATQVTLDLPPSRGDVDFALAQIPGGDALVSGTVRDQDNQPLPQAQVRFWRCAGNTCSSSQSVLTDNQGQYSAMVAPGDIQVEASKACYLGAEQEARVPPGVTVDFTLPHIVNRIFGVVTGNGGAPVYQILVSASSSHGSVSDWSDSNGYYRLNVSANTWNLRVFIPPGLCQYLPPPNQAVTTPPDQNVNFVLSEGDYTIEGDITNSSGAPMANVNILAQASGLGTVQAFSDSNGHYVLQVAAGSWQVSALLLNYTAIPVAQTVVTPPSQTGINFQMIQNPELLFLPLLYRP